MTSRHVVRRADEANFKVPAEFAGASDGFRRWSIVDEDVASVHTGFGLCELDAGGSIARHVHSFEESYHVIEGEVVIDTAEGPFLLHSGDYGVLPVGFAHGWRNEGHVAARWADMLAPQPRSRYAGDTFFVPSATTDAPLPASIDVRDPRM